MDSESGIVRRFEVKFGVELAVQQIFDQVITRRLMSINIEGFATQIEIHGESRYIPQMIIVAVG